MSTTGGSQRVVVVLGFHRSGTSMVTRMLNLLGVDLGEEAELLSAEERDNARGYWEPRWMIDLNEELLALLGSGTFEPFAPEPGWERSERLDPLRERARELVDRHFGATRLWGWKDPRTSLTLPFWRTVVEAPMSFVVCVRSPADAVASALKRGVVDVHRWTYAERWLDYTAAALANTAPADRMLAFYEDALADPAGETHRLADFLSLAEPSDEQLAQAAGSVEPELRHHLTNPLDVAVDPGLPVETRALYLLLRARRELERGAAEHSESARLGEAAERIGVELGALRRAVTAHEVARRQAEDELERYATRERDAEEARTELEARAAVLGSELEAAAEAIAARDEALAARDAAIIERDAYITELTALVEERDAAIATYRDSRSWRLTQPLRVLGERLRERRSR